MSLKENDAEQQGRSTKHDLRRYAESAALRAGRLTAETIRLMDQDPADYRQMLIDSFDEETRKGMPADA